MGYSGAVAEVTGTEVNYLVILNKHHYSKRASRLASMGVEPLKKVRHDL